MATKRIFVSHSHTDNEWCRVFVDALAAVGYDVWYDETGLQGADEWVRSLEREIEARDILLLVLTPDAIDSSWVRREIDLAIATHRMVLPIMVRPTEVTGFLRTIQRIDVVGQDALAAARLTIAALEAPVSRPVQPSLPRATAEETPTDLVILARQHWKAKQWAEAVAECNRALSMDPKCVAALKLRAVMLEASAEPWEAAMSLVEALTLRPHDDDARGDLERLATRMENDAVFRLRQLIAKRKIPFGIAGNDLDSEDDLPF